MSEKMKETKDVVALAGQMVRSGFAIAADKKISMDDLPALFMVLQKIPAVIENAKDIPTELSAMSEADAAELVAFAITECALPEGKAQKIVNHSLKIAVEIYGIVQAIRE